MGQFEDMDAFVRIVDAGGIGRAAKQLGVAKSAVSRRLVELEKRLGVQLINRTTRQSSLTEAGRSYYQRGLQILDDVTELNATTSNTQALLQGVLRVSVPVSFGLQHLTPAVTEFADMHPKLIVHLDFTDRLVDLVEDGFDLAIRITALKDSTLVARKLAPVRIILCASRDYLARYGWPESPQDLKTHVGLHYSFAPRSSWTFTGPDGQETSIALPVRMAANNGEFLRDAAIAGHGLALQPTFIVWKQIEKGELVPVMTDYTVPSINAYAVYPQTRHLSQRVRALIDFLTDRFSGAPYWDRNI